jgi:hypothetical protein
MNIQERAYTKGRTGILVPNSGLVIGGEFLVEHFRRSKSGLLHKIHEQLCKNLVVNEGLNHILNVTFNNTSQITQWYLSLFKGNYTPISTNTAASFTGAATEITGGDMTSPATRDTYDDATSTAQSITNSASRASFVFNATLTAYGAFIQSTSAYGNATGVLLCAAKFGASRSVVATDQLDVTYTLNATST